MADAYNFLNGSQTDINRRLLRKIEALEKATQGESGDISDLESSVEALEKDVKDITDAIGDESTADTILYRIKALEDA